MSSELVTRILAAGEFTPGELAAALNVDPLVLEGWRCGTSTPDPEVSDRLRRAVAAMDADGVFVEIGVRRGPVRMPEKLWEPAFAPRGRFRLPLNLEWSGTGEQRWRDAGDRQSLLIAYTIVMTEGRVGDMIRWIDPRVVAGHMDDIVWPRGYEGVWRAALIRWGLLLPS